MLDGASVVCGVAGVSLCRLWLDHCVVLLLWFCHPLDRNLNP